MNTQSLVIIAALVMLALAVGIILFVVLYQRRVINHQNELKDFNRRKQEELMQASIRSEEEERMRIAGELHDDVGATLSSIRLMLSHAVKNPGNGSVIGQARDLLDDSIQKVRNLSHQLQPGTLQYLGLMKSIQSVAEALTRSGQITVVCKPGQPWPETRTEAELSLYRIVQELLNNIIKHSGAGNVDIITEQDARQASIIISHDGHGLDQNTYHEMLYKKGAIGLKNIENRLKSAGATISFAQRDPALSTITLSLPLNSEEQNRR